MSTSRAVITERDSGGLIRSTMMVFARFFKITNQQKSQMPQTGFGGNLRQIDIGRFRRDLANRIDRFRYIVTI